ncbi:OLC1v1006960C1 [Oldenlandia corymbosa var. corymbosa]|uniref:OLC1v1006960C1 n=1 Tax=Oldenlandia corymbosa var. corymbosa TaxID=529605 RepID=A0AAV1DI81_OLDCO|nr:OLC1v1006960C1 [Oldenlandia corymbosa var. corymbosa]
MKEKEEGAKSKNRNDDPLPPNHHHSPNFNDLRAAPYMENLVTMYQSLNSTFTSVVSRHLSSALMNNLKEKSEVSGDQARTPRSSTNLCLGRITVDSHATLTHLPSHGGCSGTNEGLETQVEDMHPGPQPTPETSPSFCDNKVRNCNDVAEDGRCGGQSKAKMPADYLLETTDYERDAKRQKMLDYSSPESGVNDIGRNEHKVCSSDTTATSNNKFEEELSVAKPISLKRSVCAFCQTSKETDVTGPLLCYANGKQVDGETNRNSNVIPVHSNCIDWTPMVYYAGDIIKNLESELGRSAKLKCSSCGKKGAALGCFEKSCRRTYHVPCAFDIQECRWDSENFLMLCPSHYSVKFPKEKSKPRKSAAEPKQPKSTERIPSNSGFEANLPGGPKEWVFCGSALSAEEKFVLIKFATMCGATVSKFWRPNVTHVIAATDENGACTRTLKVLMGILNGRWILNMGWIRASMEANLPLDEGPYEISIDNHGCLDGPKTGRLRVSNEEPKLFEGINFYFTGDFVPAYKFDLFDLVRTAGGIIHESMEQLKTLTSNVEANASCLVVYNGDPPHGCLSGEGSSVVSERIAEAHNLAKQINCSVAGHKWILDSIAACRLLTAC